MTAYLLAGPETEPVSLADAKAFLRVDTTAEDGLIVTLIAAARLHVEATTARALIAQSWRLVLDCWPFDRIVPLPVGPVMSLTAVTAYDEAGDDTEIDLGQFQVETGVAPARLLLPAEIEGMPVLRERQGIEIDFAAGYGADAADVPMDLKHAILTLVGYWFEHRDAVIVAGAGAVVPAGFDRLVAPYKRVRL
jgi:uncharacterized phiE125 gp8 family phage protein